MFIKKGDRINEKYSDVGIFLPNEYNYWDQFWLLDFLKVALKRHSLKENMLYFCLTVPVLTLVYISWGNVLEQFIEITLLYLIYRKDQKIIKL